MAAIINFLSVRSPLRASLARPRSAFSARRVASTVARFPIQRLPREALSVAIAKYHSYLKEKTLIDKIFDEFDKDKASARARRPRQ